MQALFAFQDPISPFECRSGNGLNLLLELAQDPAEPQSKRGGFGMTPWCVVLICSWRRLLADRHSLPFPWTLSLHKRWCPLTTLRPSSSSLPCLSLSTSLSFPLAFPSIGGGAHRPLTTLCPSSSSLPNPSLSTSLSFPLVGCANGATGLPVSLLSVGSTQRRVTALAVGQVRPSGHPKPAVRNPSPTAAFEPRDVHLQGLFPDGGNTIQNTCVRHRTKHMINTKPTRQQLGSSFMNPP